MAPTLLVRGNLKGEPTAVPVDAICAWVRRLTPGLGGSGSGSGAKKLADRVAVVRSETGSGKSTVLPAHLFRLLRDENTPASQKYNGRSVLCTQPRVLTAVSLATDMAASPHYPELFMTAAQATVGYQTGPLTEKPTRGLVYATAGVLLAQLRGATDAEIIDRYAIIVIDEAHERSLDTDLTLLLLRNLLVRNLGNAQLPFVLLASATIEVEKYASYFTTEAVFRVVGRQFPVERRWPESGTNDYVKEAVAKVLELARRPLNAPGTPAREDVLVFLPGLGEIRKVKTLLLAGGAAELGGESSLEPPLLVLCVDRSAVAGRSPDYRALSGPARLGGRSARRAILSTVVAETGVTIDSLGHVVDAGWSREVETYFPENASGLITRPAPQSRVLQRMGRAGRLAPGQFHPLYTEKVFDALPPQQLPEIVTRGAGPAFLTLVGACALGAPGGGGLLDRPPPDALAAATAEAAALGFVTRPEAARPLELTALGELANRFMRLGLDESRLLLGALAWECAPADAAVLIALRRITGRGWKDLVDSRAARTRPPEELLGALLPRGAPALDLLSGLDLFELFARGVRGLDLAGAEAWCEERKLHAASWFAWAVLREEILEEVAVAGWDPAGGTKLVDCGDLRAAKEVDLRQCVLDSQRLSLLRDGKNAEGRRLGGALEGLSVTPIQLVARPGFLRWKLGAGLSCRVAEPFFELSAGGGRRSGRALDIKCARRVIRLAASLGGGSPAAPRTLEMPVAGYFS